MKPSFKCLSLILAMAMGALSANPVPGASVVPNMTPQQVKEHFRGRVPVTGPDHFTLAWAHFALGEFQQAIQVGTRSLDLFESDEQKAVVYHLLARAHQANGNNNQAARFAEMGQALNPDDIEIAKFRVVLYSPNGMNDEFRYGLAHNHLKRLDPMFDQEPVFLVEAGIVAVLIGGFALTYLISTRDDNPEGQRALGQVAAVFVAAGGLLGMYAQSQQQQQTPAP